ncbi:hypothetical protein CAPTEDRAFT_195733, partial [Capitella teleta]
MTSGLEALTTSPDHEKMADLAFTRMAFGLAIGILIMVVNSAQVPIVFLVKSIRDSTSPYIKSLLISDCVFGVATTAKYVYEIIGVVSIPVSGIHAAAILCSHCHIVLVSLDRYIAIFFPLRYEGIMTSRVAGISIAIVWLVVCFFWLFAWLYVDIQSHETQYALALFMIFVFYVILVLVLILYGRIAVIAYRQNRKVNDQATTPANGISQATRTLALILGCYYIFWLPYFSVFSYSIFNVDTENKRLLIVVIDGSLLFASMTRLQMSSFMHAGRKLTENGFAPNAI